MMGKARGKEEEFIRINRLKDKVGSFEDILGILPAE